MCAVHANLVLIILARYEDKAELAQMHGLARVIYGDYVRNVDKNSAIT